MYSEFDDYNNYLHKWKELCENGEQLVDIKINGLGLFTNAKVTWDNNYNFTLTYDEYIKEYEDEESDATNPS